MLERARVEGEGACAVLATQAAERANALLEAEIARTEALARVNPAVRPEEIAALRGEHEQLLAVLPGARPRLDSLRLVTSADFLSLRR
jgi:ATP-dependent helicase HepA